MGFSGFSSSAMDVIRNNARLLRKRSMFKKANTKFDEKPLDLGNKGVIPNTGADPILLRRIREKTLREHDRARFRFFLFLCVALPVIAYFGYKAFHNFSFFGMPYAVADERAVPDPNERYLFFINDGDAWLKKRHYHNALFQYRKALEQFPGNYDARYRMAVAYSYQCQYEFKGCEEGKELVDVLKAEFPNRAELHQVEVVFTHWGTQ